jgi:hypothetical protein
MLVRILTGVQSMDDSWSWGISNRSRIHWMLRKKILVAAGVTVATEMFILS